jgi:hypothetical protein
MKHCIVLTDGEDNEYGIKRVYLCEHIIDPEEWSAEMQAFNKRVHQAHEEAYSKRGLRYGYVFNKDAHAEHVAFMEAIHPLPAFVEKHKLVPIDHVELWTWGLK